MISCNVSSRAWQVLGSVVMLLCWDFLQENTQMLVSTREQEETTTLFLGRLLPTTRNLHVWESEVVSLFALTLLLFLDRRQLRRHLNRAHSL